jgi:hypothetical protein
LTKKEHKFTAKGCYGNNPVSSSRTLFVAFIHTWVGLTSGKPPINVPQNYPSGMKLTVLRNDGHSNGANTFYTTVADYPGKPRYLNFARNSVATFSFNSSVRGFGFNSSAQPSHGDKFRLLRSNGTAIGTYFFPKEDFMFISENEPFTTVELTSGSSYPDNWTHSFIIDAVAWIPDK